MTIPSFETIISYLTIFATLFGALLAALWISLIIWAFRDMRSRSRDPFAQIMSALVVALLPIVGIIIYLILRPQETLAEAYERALEEEALLQEIEEKPRCPGCSRTTEANWLLCPHCHTRLKKACQDCNALLDLQWNLCPYCGNHHIDPYKVEVAQTAAVQIQTTTAPTPANPKASPPGAAEEAETETAVSKTKSSPSDLPTGQPIRANSVPKQPKTQDESN